MHIDDHVDDHADDHAGHFGGYHAGHYDVLFQDIMQVSQIWQFCTQKLNIGFNFLLTFYDLIGCCD